MVARLVDRAVPHARRNPQSGPGVNWEKEAKAILKAEIKRRNMTYADLAGRFEQMGVQTSEAAIRNKISRGSFSASFLLQCLAALKCSTVHLDLPEPLP